LLGAFLLFGFQAPAFAQLLITPFHLVMEGRDRSKQLILVNTSNQTNTYRMEWTQLKQIEGNGGYTLDDSYQEGDNRFLQNFAVYSPRQITIAPGEKQTVRVAVRRPADLPPGEYMSHLKFHIISRPEGAKNGEYDPSLKEGEIKLGIQVRASYSIPIIYRVGDYDIDVQIGQPSFVTKEKTGNMGINIPVSRTGTHGVIGAVKVYHTPNGGEKTLIGELGNANLFASIDNRIVKVSTQLEGLSPGIMSVVFNKAEGDTSEHYVMTEKTFPVGN